MAALVIDNTVQFRLVWSLSGSPFAVNVVHGIKDDPLGDIDAARVQGIANNLSTRLAAMSLASRQAISNQITLASVGARDLDQANLPEYLATPSPTFTFAGAVELLPLNVASCVTLRTDRAGASYRGRLYITGFGEGQSAGGVMASQAVTASTDIATAIKNALDDSGFTMSVASRKLGVSRPVTTLTCRDTRWDTQRRRIVPGI